MAVNKKTVATGGLQTGVAGLDQILGGGLPGAHLYLVQGTPGTGKTTLGLQFLMSGVAQGEKVLYVSLSQTVAELRQMAKSHKWSLKGVVVEDLQATMDPASDVSQTVLHTVDLELDRTRSAIEKALQKHKPTRLVYDSLLEVRHLSQDGLRYRRELLGLKAFITENKIATLMIDTETDAGGDPELEGIAHGIIRLEKALPEYGVAKRRVEVKKMRGVAFADGYHDMAIRLETGVEVYPRVVPALAAEEKRGDLVTSGVPRMDEMLGGGLEGGTTALIMGQAGTGKSTLASLYAFAALKRGESVSMFLFEERLETFFRRCDGLGIELRDYAKSGKLRTHDFSPAEISAGEFSMIAQRDVDDHGASVVIIDSFTGYISALPQGNQAVPQIHSLLRYLTRRGVLAMLIVAQHGLLGQNVTSEVDVSFLGDTVLLLRMYEWPGLIRRTITIVKKRHGPHDLEVFELNIDKDGVTISPFNPPPPGSAGPAPVEQKG